MERNGYDIVVNNCGERGRDDGREETNYRDLLFNWLIG